MSRRVDRETDSVRQITSRDVATEAKVSQTTVSRVLNGSPGVRPATRASVLRALDKLSYAPNATARAMRTRRTGTVGVAIARITNPFYPELLEVLGTELATAGRRMILWESEAGERAAIDAIRERVVDAVIFTTATSDFQPLREAISRGLPVVLVNRWIPELPCDSVTSNNELGGASVARYFLANGRRRLAMIGGVKGTSTGDERHSGFAGALWDANIGADEWPYLLGDFTYQHGFDSMIQLLQSPSPPEAVFCANDLLAFGALSAAKHARIGVPDDVWVAGYDDVHMAAWPTFDLTTVRQPITRMVATAVRFAIDRIEGNQEPPRNLRFKSELVIRGSSGGLELASPGGIQVLDDGSHHGHDAPPCTGT
jgi:LacI family transcriptional regulator